MMIVCDRCMKSVTSFDDRKDWSHVELSEKGYGKLNDYYLCKECSNAFYRFLANKACGGNAASRLDYIAYREEKTDEQDDV